VAGGGDDVSTRQSPQPVVPPCRCRTSFRGDGRYAYLQGTSMATAQVSAVAALARQVNPDLRGLEIVRLLKQTARRAAAGFDSELGWGIVDARAAVAAARRLDRRPPVSELRAPRRVRGSSFLLRWRGADDGPPGVRTSGVDVYEVWRATGRSRPVRIARTRKKQLRVGARPGRRYTFFTVAVDRAVNRALDPAAPRRDRPNLKGRLGPEGRGLRRPSARALLARQPMSSSIDESSIPPRSSRSGSAS
jgi:hypothetical protein